MKLLTVLATCLLITCASVQTTETPETLPEFVEQHKTLVERVAFANDSFFFKNMIFKDRFGKCKTDDCRHGEYHTWKMEFQRLLERTADMDKAHAIILVNCGKPENVGHCMKIAERYDRVAQAFIRTVGGVRNTDAKIQAVMDPGTKL